MLTAQILRVGAALLALAYPGSTPELGDLLALDVELADGRVPEVAWVKVDGLKGLVRWTPDSRRVRRPEPPGTIQAYAGLVGEPRDVDRLGHPVCRWKSQPLSVPNGALPVSIVLGETRGIAVDFVGSGADTEAIDRFSLALIERRDLQDRFPGISLMKGLNDAKWKGREAYPRIDGRAYITDVPAGEWVVGLVDDRANAESYASVEVRAGFTPVVLEVRDPKARGAIQLTLTGTGGEPIRAPLFSSVVTSATHSNTSGGLAYEEVSPGTFRILRADIDAEFESRGLVIRGSRSVALRFDSPGLIGGALYVEPDEPNYSYRFDEVTDVSMLAVGDLPDHFGVRLISMKGGMETVGRFGEGQRATFGAVELGPHRLEWVFLGAPRGRNVDVEGVVVARQDVVIRPGMAAIESSVPASRSVRVRLPDPAGRNILGVVGGHVDRPFFSLRHSSVSLAEPVNGMQEVEFSGLSDGPYTLYGGPWFRRQKIEVKGDTIVEYRDMPAIGARVHITDPFGLMAEWGFESGDVVTGLDGEALHVAPRGGLDWGSSIFDPAMADLAAATVVRGGERIELELGPLKEQMSRLGAEWDAVFELR